MPWDPDDPRWDCPTGLKLRDGREVFIDDLPFRYASDFLRMALETGARIGGEIDPREVEAIGPVEEEAAL